MIYWKIYSACGPLAWIYVYYRTGYSVQKQWGQWWGCLLFRVCYSICPSE